MLLVCIHSFSVVHKIMFACVMQAEEEEVEEEEEEEEEETKSEDNEVDAEKDDDEDDDTPAHEELQKVEGNQYLWKY